MPLYVSVTIQKYAAMCNIQRVYHQQNITQCDSILIHIYIYIRVLVHERIRAYNRYIGEVDGVENIFATATQWTMDGCAIYVEFNNLGMVIYMSCS